VLPPTPGALVVVAGLVRMYMGFDEGTVKFADARGATGVDAVELVTFPLSLTSCCEALVLLSLLAAWLYTVWAALVGADELVAGAELLVCSGNVIAALTESIVELPIIDVELESST
jgi:hypothetical protein